MVLVDSGPQCLAPAVLAAVRRRVEDPERGTDFSLVLNIASVCLAGPAKNTESSAREGVGGWGEAMCL